MACDAHDGLRVVGEASNGGEALQVCEREDPDVVLLDLFLPDMDGLEVIERLRVSGRRARILMISAGPGSKAVFAAMRAGAAGFVDKTSPQDEIAATIERVARGDTTFTTEQANQVSDEFGDFVRSFRESSRLHHALTGREREVLELIREGLITRSIASRMKLSERTVETHIKKLYRKLKVSSRVEAVMRAEKFGLLPPADPGAVEPSDT